jgi:hypothetical protein
MKNRSLKSIFLSSLLFSLLPFTSAQADPETSPLLWRRFPDPRPLSSENDSDHESSRRSRRNEKSRPEVQPTEDEATTTSGALYTGVSIQLERQGIPATGWKDPRGLIWFSPSRYHGRVFQYEAESECERHGAQLPARDDFAQLRHDFGHSQDHPEGYRPQILYRLRNNYFWTSTPTPNRSSFFVVFNGENGVFRNREGPYSRAEFYCVIR